MWLVKHRDGTCALKNQRRKQHLPEGTVSVPTLCGHFISLPSGFLMGEPTCAECVKKAKG